MICFFSSFLSAYPSIHLSIYLACLPVYLSVSYLVPYRFFRDKPFYRHFLLLTTFPPLDIAFRRFIKIFPPISRAANGIRINRTSVKEANLSSVVTQPLHFPFHLFTKPHGNFVTSNCCSGQTELRFF